MLNKLLAHLWIHKGIRYVLAIFFVAFILVLLNSAVQYAVIVQTLKSHPEEYKRVKIGSIFYALQLGLEFTYYKTLFQLFIPVAIYRCFKFFQKSIFSLPVLALVVGFLVNLVPFLLNGRGPREYQYEADLIMVIMRSLTAFLAGWMIYLLAKYKKSATIS